jgi:hypothetical protein
MRSRMTSSTRVGTRSHRVARRARATSLQHLSMRPKLSTPGVPGGVGNAPSGTFPVGDGPIRSGLPPKPRTRPSIVAR